MRVEKECWTDLEPGEYAKINGVWYACAPDTVPFDSECVPKKYLANLVQHDVTEHEDGTITVAPSILITVFTPEPLKWHGYLRRGEWTRLQDSNV